MEMGFDLQRTLLWIVLLPLLGAIINGVFGRRSGNKNLVTAVAVGSVFGAFLLSLVGFGYLIRTPDENGRFAYTVYEWFSITVHGTVVPIQVRFVMDHLSGIMAVMVSGVGSLIHVYSIGYMSEDPGYARFMTYLNLFMASMLILVLASSMPLMFVGWEGVGLCSYLLIGFWYENRDYAAAGRKAFVVNRIGDFGVLLGMFILVYSVVPEGGGAPVEAFEFSAINGAAASLGSSPFMLGPVAIGGVTVATLAVLFLFLGCTGKSAQIPLYVWLPDAMAGPTPVSALIHAATMVTAGVYLMVRLSPLVVESPVAMAVIAITGALTALVAASIALVQNQMKKVLAYSTVSQLGFMFAAVGSGAFAGGFFHVFTHAFFKACLFLGAGSVMHAIGAHGDADIRYLGGLRKYMPRTHWTFGVATVAIAGLPIFSGFFSKDEILLGATTWAFDGPPGMRWVGWTVFAILIVAAVMTAFYMFRLYFRTFWGEYKGGHAPGEHGHDDHGDEHDHDDEHEHHHVEPHESPDTMTIPLIALAIGAAAVGFLGLPHTWQIGNWWSGWLTPQYETFVETLEEASASGNHEEALRQATDAAREVASNVAVLQFRVPSENVPHLAHGPAMAAWLAMGLGLLAGLLGLGIAFFFYYQKNGEPAAALESRMKGLHRVLMNKWYVDEFYGATVVAFNKWLAVFAANVDRVVVDGLLAKVTAAGAKATGYLFTRTQTGTVYAYAGMFVIGLAGLGWWFTYPHADLRRVDDDTVGTVTWDAGQGLGYQYRWDFDSDGEWDTGWTDDAVAEHGYEGAAYYALAAIVQLPPRVVSPVEVLAGDEERRTLVLEPGDTPETLPVEGFVPYAGEDETPPTIAYRTVVRVDGTVPEAARGEGDAPVEVDLTLVDGEGHRLFGPERHEVHPDAGGAFSALLGANQPLRASLVGEGASVQISVGGQPVEQPARLEGGAHQVALVRLNGAAVQDTDGVQDGMLAVDPGQTVSIGAARLTVAVRIRGTVEVRNPFGNLAKSSEDVTLRIGREPARTARLEQNLGESAQ